MGFHSQTEVQIWCQVLGGAMQIKFLLFCDLSANERTKNSWVIE